MRGRESEGKDDMQYEMKVRDEVQGMGWRNEAGGGRAGV